MLFNYGPKVEDVRGVAKDIERSCDVMSRARGGACADRDPRGRRAAE